MNFFISTILFSILSLILLSALIFIARHENYYDKICARLGIKHDPTIDYAVASWASCLEYLDYNADIVFFGDSLTRGGNFQSYFKQYKICNLGYSGESLDNMLKRVNMISYMNPKNVFIMGGINSLKKWRFSATVKEYKTLLENIKTAVPNATLYIQSMLPVSKLREKNSVDNATIRRFNSALKNMATEHGFTYIDLYSAFEKNGYINSTLTTDGIHLQKSAYALWSELIHKYI